jgi:hypothetical protein
VEKETIPQTKPALKRAWATIVEDLRSGAPKTAAGTVHLGDARALNCKIADDFDFVLYSPPYPNNIDYTEVYKLELSALGYITNNAEFRSQRLKTLRSHPSITFPDQSYADQLGLDEEFTKIIKPVLDAIPEDRYERGRTAVVRGYFDDMLIALDQQYKKLRRGGRVFCVVGNSVHGKETPLVIASDLVLAKIGGLIGFDVEKVAIARHLSRRKVKKSLLPYARESIVVLKKP